MVDVGLLRIMKNFTERKLQFYWGILFPAIELAILILSAGNVLGSIDSYPQAYIFEATQMVLSDVKCSNPQILIGLAADEYNEVESFKNTGKLPIDFKKVYLGKNIVGYRAELLIGGSGLRGYRRAWLFELYDGKLKKVFELRGPHLFITDIVVNGRYLMWHWEGIEPATAKQRSIEWRDSRYVEGPIVSLE